MGKWKMGEVIRGMQGKKLRRGRGGIIDEEWRLKRYVCHQPPNLNCSNTVYEFLLYMMLFFLVFFFFGGWGGGR